jgi:2-succinyl-6-hydroxy-2,4-cyclohexadiene-1-carboxylate synthase
MPEIQFNGVHYHVEIVGEGAPLVLLHGFTGSSQNWRPHIPEFSKYYQTISIDLLGHGLTESPLPAERYRMDCAAKDLVEIIQRVTSDPVNLLGYSMGGRLALYTALQYPDSIQRLILESASPGLETSDERQTRIESDHQLVQRIQSEGIEGFVEYWESIPLFESQRQLSAATLTAIRAQRLKNNQTGLVNSLIGMGTGAQPSLWNQLQLLKKPVLLITGEMDKKFVAIAERMHYASPIISHVVVPAAGHTVHLEQSEKFQQVVLNFLAERSTSNS